MIFRKAIVGVVFAFLLLYYSQSSAQAHEGEPRLELSVERIHPGGVLELRGVDFEPEKEVQISLMGAGLERAIGVTIADMDGTFNQIVTLPPDLAEGSYIFRAASGDDRVDSPPIAVQGTAPVETAGEGGGDQSDSLLAPMPTKTPANQAVPLAVAAPSPRRFSGQATIVLVLVLIAILGGFAVWRFRRARRR